MFSLGVLFTLSLMASASVQTHQNKIKNHTLEVLAMQGLQKYSEFESKVEELNSKISYLKNSIEAEQQKHPNYYLTPTFTQDLRLM